ncbi:MAG: hypothetical protein LPK58_10090 [Gammaproteobacteria bacterium]|nr:hypothetical protein [Gammaproteobacteria bacterium]MDX5375845.1 hypothetical protein [Gammaproteobacteria bacterium]
MTASDRDTDIPTLTDLVQPGSHSRPAPPPVAERQLDIPLAPEPATATPAADPPATGPEDADFFAEAVREAEAWLGMEYEDASPEADERTGTPGTAAHIDAAALLSALEPRIEALVDEALSRQLREARDEIVGRVMAALHEALAGPADEPPA